METARHLVIPDLQLQIGLFLLLIAVVQRGTRRVSGMRSPPSGEDNGGTPTQSEAAK
jgi:hypothetical protein